MEIKSVNLVEKFKQVQDYWYPAIIGKLNGQLVKIAKIKGDFVWHKHNEEDELFFVMEGKLEIALKDQVIILKEGEFTIIPKGVLHKPMAKEEVKVLLFEPESTVNTGDTINDFTQSDLEEL